MEVDNHLTHLVISAPGKVILHGEHAVVHGKRALACSLDLRTYLHVTKDNTEFVRMNLPDIKVYREWKVSELQLKFSSLPKKSAGQTTPIEASKETFDDICVYCGIEPDTVDTKELAVVAFLYLFTSILSNDQLEGYDLMVSSNLPTSAGLGSSAAFAVTLVTSLLRLSGQISDPGTEPFNTWPKQDLELINSWAFIGEKIIHGNPSGVDNSVSTYGGIVKYQNMQIEHLSSKHDLEVILTNTKVPRSTKLMVAGVGAKLNRFPALMHPVLDAIEAIAIKCQEAITSDTPIQVDIIKELITDNQSLLCILGVNHSALDTVCRITAEHGLCSKLTGAGGGGCAFTYIPPGSQSSHIDAVMSLLRESGFDCWRTVVGGPGVGLHHGRLSSQFKIPEALHSRAEHCHIL